MNSVTSAMAKATNSFIKESTAVWPETVPELSRNHCIQKLNELQENDVEDGKANRLIGWVQACCVIAGIATMEDFRILNSKQLLNTKL